MVTADFEEPFEEDNELNLNDFEVTRTEFFAHTREPSFIFNDGKVGVNTACVRRLPDVDYVQLLINRNKRKLAIRACEEEDVFSIQWAKTKDGKRHPRQITGRMFFMKVCDMMGWNPDYRYKILGNIPTKKASVRQSTLFIISNLLGLNSSPGRAAATAIHTRLKSKDGKTETHTIFTSMAARTVAMVNLAIIAR